MSKLSQYRDLQQRLERFQEEMKALESDPAFKSEIEFENKLFALLDKYNVSAETAIKILNPDMAKPAPMPAVKPTKKPPTTAKAKRPRSIKLTTYVNPHTEETATVGTLRQMPVKAWCDEHGTETVRQWMMQ